MAKRTGVPTLLDAAVFLCSKLAKFRTVIFLLYPDNTALLAAYVAAESACATLSAEMAAVREYGD